MSWKQDIYESYFDINIRKCPLFSLSLSLLFLNQNSVMKINKFSENKQRNWWELPKQNKVENSLD